MSCLKTQDRGTQLALYPSAASTTHLLLGLRFLHVVSANFDAGGEQGAGEICHPQTQEAAEFLGS